MQRKYATRKCICRNSRLGPYRVAKRQLHFSLKISTFIYPIILILNHIGYFNITTNYANDNLMLIFESILVLLNLFFLIKYRNSKYYYICPLVIILYTFVFWNTYQNIFAVHIITTTILLVPVAILLYLVFKLISHLFIKREELKDYGQVTAKGISDDIRNSFLNDRSFQIAFIATLIIFGFVIYIIYDLIRIIRGL